MAYNWEAIQRAVEILLEGNINKLEGKGWLVYRVGTVIRIDLKEK